MKTLVLTPPDTTRWALENVLLNAGHELEVFTDPRDAGRAFEAGDHELVVIEEPEDGKKFTAKFLADVVASGREVPHILVVTDLPSTLERGLGELAGLITPVPAPVNGLILKMMFEDLGLAWSAVPMGRLAVTPPVPDRPWGRRGMKEGTVDAAGIPVEVASSGDDEDGDDDDPAAEAEA